MMIISITESLLVKFAFNAHFKQVRRGGECDDEYGMECNAFFIIPLVTFSIKSVFAERFFRHSSSALHCER